MELSDSSVLVSLPTSRSLRTYLRIVVQMVKGTSLIESEEYFLVIAG